MHRQSIQVLVYRQLYPNPRSSDPPTFANHLTRNLVPEVRAETSTFYGTLDTIEARYPGLDYTHPPHRVRLGRFWHHRRLFLAFDDLGLTKDEILSLCRWEGTRWARESYERQEGITVRDTTGEEIPPWVDPRQRAAAAAKNQSINVSGIEVVRGPGRSPAEMDMLGGAVDMNDDADESEEELESVGLELNQRLSAAAEARERGADDVVMDPEWEQWLKYVSEQGILDDPVAVLRSGPTGPPFAPVQIPPGSTGFRQEEATVGPAGASSGTAV